MNLIIYTDGASRGNPGLASYGFIIKDDQGVILHQEGKYIGQTTNNIAEYSAIKAALEYAKGNFPKAVNVNFFMDSQLAARQLSGFYRVKNPRIAVLYADIKKLEVGFDKVSYTHVPRAENFIADRLANKALDELR